ncbi:hypothetical protein D3C73_1187960 [compost metagenome]
MCLDGEQSIDADLQAVVGHDRQDGRGQAHGFAHGQGDVGVEATGGFNVFGQGHEGDSEDQQDCAGNDVAHGGAYAPNSDGHGRHAGHHGQGSCCGDHQEGDTAGAYGISFEPIPGISCRGSGFEVRHGDPLGCSGREDSRGAINKAKGFRLW